MDKIRKKEEIEGALQMVNQMRASAAMEIDSWAKCLVSLCYEFTLIQEDMTALRLLASIPVDYFKFSQINQMKEDSMYRDLVVLLSYKLIQMGVVEGSECLNEINMPEARA
jgi:hypothetical protein